VKGDLQDLAALVCSSCPYETTAEVLTRLTGLYLLNERLRQLTNEQGSALAKQQREQTQEVLQEAVSMEQIRAQRIPSTPEVKHDQAGWVPSSEQNGGMEGKIGVIANQVDVVGKQGRHGPRPV
jgi:hypothetical protein